MIRRRGFDRTHLLAALVVVLTAVGVYANSVGNDFVLDDRSIIVQNPNVHGVERLDEAVTSPYWPRTPRRIALYRPLTVATYAVEWDLWNGDATGFHAVNVALHAAASVLVLAVLAALGVPLWAAAVGAVIFAVHPVHTEAVANVVGRAEVLATMFFLLACLLYLRTGVPRLRRASLIGVCYLLALGSKEIAVTLPATLLLLEAARHGLGGVVPAVRREAAVWIAIGLAAVAYVGARVAVLGVPVGNDVAPFLADLSWSQQLATAVRVWPEYLRLMVFPRHLVADYSPGVIFPVEGFSWLVVFGLGLAAALAALAVATWRRGQRLPAIGLAWFAITVFPVSNLLVRVGVLLAERTLYLPSVAVAIIAAHLAVRARAARPRLRYAAVTVGIAAVVLGGWRTVTRNRDWRSPDAFIQDLARTHPESYRVQWLIGQRLIQQGRLDEGMYWMDRAVEVVPNHYRLLVEYGVTLTRFGRPVEAERVLRRAVLLVPENAEAQVFLSRSLLNQDRGPEALEVIHRARERFPDLSAVYHQLAYVYDHVGQRDSAYAARRRSLRLAGDRADWRQWLHLAELEYGRGREGEAVTALDRARSAAPERERANLSLPHLRERLSGPDP